tara:strand:- start:1257 stop:1877 length:621 start_codon:yes stop_codon:yes gene_type:complete
MTIAIAPILNRASTLLLDGTGVRWPQTELLDWLNDGVLEIATMKPLLFTARSTMPIAAGVFQTIPAGTRQLHRIIANIAGPVVRIVPEKVINSQDPGWYEKTPTALVKYVILEEFNSKHFLCYPPNDGTGQLDAVFSIDPPVLVADGTIDIDLVYSNPLLAFVLYRAFLKDADTSDDAKAAAYYETFSHHMGLSVVGEAQVQAKEV